jgi:licheninase
LGSTLIRVSIALLSVLSGVVATPAASWVVPHANAAGNCPVTAGEALGWGVPSRVEEFDSPDSLAGWKLYTGPGHVGNGRRVSTAATVDNGQLVITGDPAGDTAGMSWLPGQTLGRWEVCMATPVGSPNYHSVALLWPDSEVWPSDGEVDFMEILDPARQTVEFNLHYGPDNRQERTSVNVDATQWHSWAVEWTPKRVVGYLDGQPWFESADPAHLPPGPMHLCIQLDNFGGDISQGGRQLVDWVRQYLI